jgi:hypothetical protein
MIGRRGLWQFAEEEVGKWFYSWPLRLVAQPIWMEVNDLKIRTSYPKKIGDLKRSFGQ